jgi:hypothetical protein
MVAAGVQDALEVAIPEQHGLFSLFDHHTLQHFSMLPLCLFRPVFVNPAGRLGGACGEASGGEASGGEASGGVRFATLPAPQCAGRAACRIQPLALPQARLSGLTGLAAGACAFRDRRVLLEQHLS